MKLSTKNKIQFALRNAVTLGAAAGAIVAPKLFDNQIADVLTKAAGVALAGASVDGGFALAEKLCETEVTVTKTEDTVTLQVHDRGAETPEEPPKANVKKETIKS